jgi:hypothetical protein
MMRPFITGTRAYGPARPGSDLDIVMPARHAEKLKHILWFFGIEVFANTDEHGMQYASGWKFDLFGQTIQIIEPLSDIDFDAWEYATSMMYTHAGEPIEDRVDRLARFESYKYDYYSRGGPQ